jgi:hypothetical protein
VSSLLALVSVLALVISGATSGTGPGTTAGAAPPIDGRLVDARTGAPIAGAEITIVGQQSEGDWSPLAGFGALMTIAVPPAPRRDPGHDAWRI